MVKISIFKSLFINVLLPNILSEKELKSELPIKQAKILIKINFFHSVDNFYFNLKKIFLIYNFKKCKQNLHLNDFR